tara:strand:+ start:214 stop:726 length:513 start_codon:yes stop_codon:yes gene_type:complete
VTRVLVIVLSVLVAGCQSPFALEERWRPLVEIAERPDLVPSDPVATTLGTRVYVSDLDGFFQAFSPESPEFEALLLHEREHALRQRDAGLGPWLTRYLSDRAFMWREEQAGWFLQLRRLQAAGRPLVPRAIARALAGYRNLTGRMVSEQEALDWVRAVLAGTWTPEVAGG